MNSRGGYTTEVLMHRETAIFWDFPIRLQYKGDCFTKVTLNTDVVVQYVRTNTVSSLMPTKRVYFVVQHCQPELQ